MVKMIYQMTLVTALYVLLTVLLRMRVGDIAGKRRAQIAVGLIYGVLCVLSTHFGVDYVHMRINVRDLGPLTAGLFFHPVSGVIAGVIGGVERYIAGRFWDVGSYTRVACGVSTLLAGILPIPLYRHILRRQRLTPLSAFFIGAVMEVFHMYAVFITHRDDMSTAYYVVHTAAPPMIVFNGLGLAASAIINEVMDGVWHNPFRRREPTKVSVYDRFQTAMFAVITVIFIINTSVSFALQTRASMQSAQDSLLSSAKHIRGTYEGLQTALQNYDQTIRDAALADARSAALSVEAMGGMDAVDDDYLDALRESAGLSYLRVADGRGEVRHESPQTGAPEAARSFIKDILTGKERVGNLTNGWVMASAPCDGGSVTVAMNPSLLAFSLDLNTPLTHMYVGMAGSFDFIRPSGIIAAGVHQWQSLSQRELELLKAQPDGAFFTEYIFGSDSLCWAERTRDGLTLLLRLPLDEVYDSRNTQLYESCFEDILLVAVIYIMISLLLEELVVNNLRQINGSLDRITSGRLDEVVEVRGSSEFTSLSDDINHTVDTLKGYIEAAEKRIEKELSFAAAIQDAALPKNFTFKRNDFELFALMDPAKEVGGDFYDFFFVSYNRLALVIADVSGKGIPAALFMMRAKTAIRSLAVKGSDPDVILRDANNMLCEGNDAQMFVTAWLGIIDLTTGSMLCANAGHEYPTIMRVGGEYELLKDKHGLALACMENMRFKTYELKLNPGDRLFVYTDGVPEAINPDFEQYGDKRMLAKLNTMRDWRMNATLPELRQDIASFAETAEQFDDITMLGFIYNGSSETAPTSREE